MWALICLFVGYHANFFYFYFFYFHPSHPTGSLLCCLPVHFYCCRKGFVVVSAHFNCHLPYCLCSVHCSMEYTTATLLHSSSLQYITNEVQHRVQVSIRKKSFLSVMHRYIEHNPIICVCLPKKKIAVLFRSWHGTAAMQF